MNYSKNEKKNQIIENLDMIKRYVEECYSEFIFFNQRVIDTKDNYSWGGTDRYRFNDLNIFVGVGFELMYGKNISEFFSVGIILNDEFVDLAIALPTNLIDKVFVGFSQEAIKKNLKLLVDNEKNFDCNKINRILLNRRKNNNFD